MLKAMAFFGGPCLFPFPPLCNKEWKCFRENKQSKDKRIEKRKRKGREKEKAQRAGVDVGGSRGEEMDDKGWTC